MLRLLSTAALLLISSQAVSAQDLLSQYQDKIRTEIDQGWKHLSAHELNDAANSFARAGGIVRMVRVKELEVLLPDAPEGWTKIKKTEEDLINEATAGNIMGGMSMVSATYTKGEQAAKVTIVGESKILSTMIELAKASQDNNFAQKADYKGGFLEFKQSPSMNQMSIMLPKPATNIQIDGQGMSKETAMIFANLIDIEAVKKAMVVQEPNEGEAE